MSKQKFLMLVAISLAGSGFAAKERVIQVQNSARIGFDDNVYSQDSGEVESAFLTDIVNLTGKMNFSARTGLLLYWQPEVRYWFDVPSDDVSHYQDFYGELNHAVSQRAVLEVSERFSFNEARGSLANSTTDTDNNMYVENDLDATLDYTLNPVSQARISVGQGMRRWDDSEYATGSTYRNDFDQYRLEGSFVRELKPNATKGMAGLSYMDHEYAGSRGGYNSTTVFGGLDHNFSPNLSAYGRLGYTFASVENDRGSDDDSNTPYAQAGVDYSPTARTSMGASASYSVSHADNSFFNAQERLSGSVTLRHDITGKIGVSTALSCILGSYDGSFAYIDAFDRIGEAVLEEEELYFTWSVRGSYQVNRNNFIDAGYQFADRSTDEVVLRDHTRNRFDIGWRVKF